MKRYILILSVLYSFSLLQAQEKDSSYKYWMTFGLGSIGDNISGNLSYSFSVGENFYKVGWLIQDEFNPIGSSFETVDFNSIDFSIGKRFESEWWQAVLFAGPSFLFGEKKVANGNRERYNTIGLQTDIQLLFKLADEIGIGVGLWGNANFEKSSAGININITLGNGK